MPLTCQKLFRLARRALCSTFVLGVGILIALASWPDISFALPNDRMSWDPGSVSDAAAPENRRGRDVPYAQMPFKPVVGVSRNALEDSTVAAHRSGYADDGSVASGNFSLAIPVVVLPGRGIDLNLTLYYNSLVWSSVANARVFNADADWPAPGWYLGFGKLNPVILMDPDGTRHQVEQVDATHRRTTDGTSIDIEDEPCSLTICVSKVSYPDGRIVEFTGSVNVASQRNPTRITDRNGNFITISYVSSDNQAISSIVDTVGRKFDFFYDSNSNLIAICKETASGYKADVFRLHYFLSAAYLSSPRHLENGFGYLIDAVTYPEKETGFWFGKAFAKSGQMATINWQVGIHMRGASYSAQGDVVPGQTVRTRSYEFSKDMDVAAPYISKITETWQGNPDPAITQIAVVHDSGYRNVTITYPDGSQNLQVAYEATKRIDTGLVYISEVKSGDGKTLSTQFTEWEAGLDGAPRVHSVTTQNDIGLAKKTVYEYGSRNEITATNTYGFDGQLLCRRATSYLSDPTYDALHIFNLPSQIAIYSGNSSLPFARTDIRYDELPLEDAVGVGQHRLEFDPFHTPVGQYGHVARGNVTSVTSYGNAAKAEGARTRRMRYDITGNVVSISPWEGAETRYAFSLLTQFAFPDSITTGSDDPKNALKNVERYTYNDAGQPLTYVDDNKVKSVLAYRPSGDLYQIDSDGGPITSFNHNYLNLEIVQESKNRAGGVLLRSLSQLDGRGQLIRTEKLNNNGGSDVQQFKYNAAGELTAKSIPYDSHSNDIEWTNYTYDALGRMTSMRQPDGSTSQRFYNEAARPSAAGYVPGNSVRAKDAWGREVWSLFDGLGQLVETVEPDPRNTGTLISGAGFVTKYGYDVLGNRIHVEQGDQTRDYEFDALSRLIAQRIPEQSATLTDTGAYTTSVADRKWSEVRTYDERTGAIATVTDARGIRETYSYGADPLGRVQSVSFTDTRRIAEETGVSHRASTVIPVTPTTYHYVTSGDLSRREQIQTGYITETFRYDALGRVKTDIIGVNESILMKGPSSSAGAGLRMPNHDLSLATLYSYDDVGRIETMGVSEVPPSANVLLLRDELNTPSDSVTFGFGAGGRVTSADIRLKNWWETWRMDGITYNPTGKVLSRQFYDSTPLAGLFGLTETFSYDSKSLLEVRHGVDSSPIGPLLTPGPKLFDTAYTYARPSSFHIGGVLELTPQVGQMLQQTDFVNQSGNQSFVYDLVGRLSQATLGVNSLSNAVPYESLQSYGYDRYGNRVTVQASAPPGACKASTCPLPLEQQDGPAVLSADPGSNHIVGTGVVYDEAGNLVAAPRLGGQLQRYSYDEAGRLVSVMDQSGKILESYVYGADRRRVMVLDVAGNATAYVWDGGSVIAQYDVESGARRFNVRDIEGTVVSFSDDAHGNQSVQYRANDHHVTRALIGYDIRDPTPFSRTFSSTSVDSRPFGIGPPGQVFFDEHIQNYLRSQVTGLDYATNRFYNPEQGRFLQPDPLGVNKASVVLPQNLNLYSYALNDPINVGDPTGLLPITIVQIKAGCMANQSEEYGMQTCISVDTFDVPDDPTGPPVLTFGSPWIMTTAGGGGPGGNSSSSAANNFLDEMSRLRRAEQKKTMALLEKITSDECLAATDAWRNARFELSMVAWQREINNTNAKALGARHFALLSEAAKSALEFLEHIVTIVPNAGILGGENRAEFYDEMAHESSTEMLNELWSHRLEQFGETSDAMHAACGH